MTLELHWFLPTHGDGRELSRPASGDVAEGDRRAPDLDYLTQVALAADRFGFRSVLTPFGMFCEDPWLVSAALAGVTRRLAFMVALRPGLISPLVAAQMAATLQRISGNRLYLNIVTGSDADEQHRYGDWSPHDDRYARTHEFLEIFRRLWTGDRVDFTGDHYRMTGGLLTRPASRLPRIFLGGSSPAAEEAAAAHADVQLTWGETPPATAVFLNRARAAADRHGRRPAYGTRFHVISRDTSAEAWQVARRLSAGIDPARIRQAQERFARSESVGQRRMAAMVGSGAGDLEVYPNIWAGYGLVRPGVGTALIGSHEEVAARIEEFHALGLDHLVLSAQPHLEESYTFGERVMPLLRKRGLLAPAEDDLGGPVRSP